MNALAVKMLAMSAAMSWLPTGGWQRLAADALWQSSAILAAALLVAWLVRRRAALWAAVLLAAVVLSVSVPVLSSAVRATVGGVLARPVGISKIEAELPLVSTAIDAPAISSAAPSANRRTPTGSA